MLVRVILACLVLAALTGRAAAQPVKPLDGEAIAAIWKERQEKVKTATFEITHTEFWIKGAYTDKYLSLINHLNGIHEKSGSKERTHVNGPIPSADYRASTKEVLLLDGVKVRSDLSSVQVRWSSPNQELHLLPQRLAYDGTHVRDVLYRDSGEEGSISKYEEHFRDASFQGIYTVLLAFRSRTKQLALVNPHDLVSTGRRAVIDGQDCLEYRLWKRDDGSSRHMWLSPAQGWCVLRDIQVVPQGDTLVKGEYRYKPDPQAGWVPTMWENTHVMKGVVRTSSRYEVDSYTINTPIDPGTFALKFTPGTKVYHEDPPGGVVGKIQADGSILPDDGRPAYYLPGTSAPWWRRALRYGLYALIAATVSLLIVRVVRRYRRKQLGVVPPQVPPTSEGVPS